MDPIAVTALVLSIISILLWVYTFVFKEQLPGPLRIANHEEVENAGPQAQEEVSGVPQVMGRPGTPAPSAPAPGEARFMNETQKFSQMVRKNLEMLNTRVGIKFDVKPISEEFSQKVREPSYVDSMEVSENRVKNMLTDEAEDQQDSSS